MRIIESLLFVIKSINMDGILRRKNWIYDAIIERFITFGLRPRHMLSVLAGRGA